MKFEVPDNCGSCLSIGQFGNKYFCGMPVSKEKEMLDISSFKVDINSRPDWCPKNKVINIINNLSEENKDLVDRMCDGFSAMFELMNNQKPWISLLNISKRRCPTMNNVWVVTYLGENNEPVITVFDNQLAADACYKHFYEKYRNDVWIDKCDVYGSFMVAGNEGK